jgi:hypothetical protein
MADRIEEGMNVAMIAGVAVGAYFIWKLLQSLNPNNPNTPVGAAVNSISSGIASAYEALTFGPPIQAAGDVDDLNGNLLGPISSFPAASSGGNTYLQINGATYQLGARDSKGNFTAIAASAGGAMSPSTGSTGGTYSAGSTGLTGGTGY